MPDQQFVAEPYLGLHGDDAQLTAADIHRGNKVVYLRFRIKLATLGLRVSMCKLLRWQSRHDCARGDAHKVEPIIFPRHEPSPFLPPAVSYINIERPVLNPQPVVVPLSCDPCSVIHLPRPMMVLRNCLELVSYSYSLLLPSCPARQFPQILPAALLLIDEGEIGGDDDDDDNDEVEGGDDLWNSHKQYKSLVIKTLVTTLAILIFLLWLLTWILELVFDTTHLYILSLVVWVWNAKPLLHWNGQKNIMCYRSSLN